MGRRYHLVIACRHSNPGDVILTQNGEHVCKCGVVLEEKMPDNSPCTSHSQLNLYQKVEKGSDPKDAKLVNKKIHVHSSDASAFSNVCSKLALPNFIAYKAWSLYRRLRASTKFTRAKCVAFSIYVTCREGQYAVDPGHVQDAIRSALCVKNAPGMLGVISEMNRAVTEIGIDTNQNHSDEFYLNLAISQRQEKFPDRRDYDAFKIKTINNFHALSGNPKNRARRAVEASMAEMGLVGQK